MNAQMNLIKGSRHISEMADDSFVPLPYKPISGDSHVTEPPELFSDYLDPKFRDRAPRYETNAKGGTTIVVDNMYDGGGQFKISMRTIAGAGADPKENDATWTFESTHKGGRDPKQRVADQDRDGLGGEILYATLGMVLNSHPDIELKQACFLAYNRWLADFQSYAPDRLFGLGQTAVSSIDQTIKDMQMIHDQKFCGIMMPNDPATGFEYDDPRFDPVWEAAVAYDLPLSFHILTSKKEAKVIADALMGDKEKNKGRSMANFHHTLIRANQDMISTFVWGRVFERHPKLKVVCAEADAGWVPHFMYRMDHFYRRHRYSSEVQDMSMLPSERVSENVYFTFQDDIVAFNCLNMLNSKRLLWSNDFPHPDATWPWSQQLLAYQTQGMTDEQRKDILRDNIIECYNLPVR